MVRTLAALLVGMAITAVVSSPCIAALQPMTMNVEGRQRTYFVEGSAKQEPRPTIIMLHGNNGNARAVARGSGLGELARRDGFIAVFPEGLVHSWNDGRPEHAALIRSRGVPADDVAFVKALVTDLISRGISDPQRIYLAGFSNGGFMTLRMACEAADLFAAIGTIEANMPEAYGGDCHPAVPLPFIEFSGTADRGVPYGGGGRQGVLWPTERTAGFFRKLDGCSNISQQSRLPSPEPQASGVTVIRWTDCAHAPVVLYRIEGGVHRIPEPPFAGEALWSFFRDKVRTAAADGHPRATAATAARTAAVVDRSAADRAASEPVTFRSNGYTLYGCIVRPAGEGPFPVVIYNHGSDKNPALCGPRALARAYVEHGYLFFAFQRHGHGQSPGEYIGDLQKKIRAEVRDPAARAQRSVALHDVANRDVEGAVAWLMKQPDVDRSRVVMTGVSYGGIQTLLTAEKGLGIKAFIPFAPGAMSWRNVALQNRLKQAVRDAKAPIFLAQAQNDYSIGPSQVLGPMVRAKGSPNEAKLYPAFGDTPKQGHGGFAVRGGVPIWKPDVFAFLDEVMGASRASVHH